MADALANVIAVFPSTDSARWIVARLTPDSRTRRIESAFNRLKDFRRIATRYDKLARSYLASVCLTAALVWWI